MCYTPIASILTAIIEFSIAAYMLKKIKDKKLLFLPLFVILLGIIQLSEFMLCTSGNTELWARIGFVTITFLPIIIMHFFYKVSEKKLNKLFYIIPIIFSVIALHPEFVINASCELLNIRFENPILKNNISLILYLAYYIGFPLNGIIKFSKNIKKHYHANTKLKVGLMLIPVAILISEIYFIIVNRSSSLQSGWILTSTLILLIAITIITLGTTYYIKNKENYYTIISILFFASSVTVVLLFMLMPQFRFSYSSIFCQFALLYSLVALILMQAYHKI